MALATALVSMLVAILLAFSPATVDAGIIDGLYKGSKSWVYMSRFAFNSASEGESMGKFQATFTYPNTSNPTLMLYYMGSGDDYEGYAKSGLTDEWGRWQDVVSGEYDCSTKYRIAANGGFAFPLSEMGGTPKKQELVTRDDGQEVMMITRSVTRDFVTSRTRWFFATIGDCPERCDVGMPYCANGLDVEYSFNFTNGDGWDQYFSADLQDTPEAVIAFTVFYFALACWSMVIRARLQQRRKYHHTVKLVVFAVWTAFVASFCKMIVIVHYAQAGTNENYTGFMVIGVIFDGLADQAMVLNLILIGKGWTIVRRKISGQGRMRIATYMTVYVIAYWFCQIYFAWGLDPASIEYIYSTGPGYTIVALRVLSFLWMSYAISTTLKKYKAKKGFYRKLWFLGGLWMLSIPLLVCLNEALAAYYRNRIMVGVQLGINFAFVAVMVNMYNPSGMFQASFPFHATTSEMLNAKKGTGAGNRSPGAGGNSFENAHIRRAAEISRRIKQGVTLLQSYSSDLNSFLEELDPASDDLYKDEPLRAENGHARAALQPQTSLRPSATGNTWGVPSDAVPSSPRGPGGDAASKPPMGATSPMSDSDDEDVRLTTGGQLPSQLQNQ